VSGREKLDIGNDFFFIERTNLFIYLIIILLQGYQEFLTHLLLLLASTFLSVKQEYPIIFLLFCFYFIFRRGEGLERKKRRRKLLICCAYLPSNYTLYAPIPIVVSENGES